MEITVNVILTIVGLAMLCFGGNWLVTGGVNIAKKLGVSPLIIGLTIVAYGTSTPELAASIAAAGTHTDLILGNVVGSNISNIGMVIGISAIIVPLIANQATLRREVPIMIGVSLLIIALSIDGEISQLDSVLLISGLLAFTVFMFLQVKKQRDNNVGKDLDKVKRFSGKNIYLRSGVLIAIGIVLLYFGAEFTVNNAVVIAQSFGISERVIGITIIAIGTSLPELVTSIIAIRKGHTDIGIGNIIGSNIYNILMIVGVASAIAGITINSEIYFDYLIMIGFSLVLLIIMKLGIISRNIGIGLVCGYFVYLAVTFLSPT